MISRRNFFGNSSLAFVASLLGIKAKANPVSPDEKTMDVRKGKMLAENTIEREYELVVVGGGISGVCTAISAARQGMKVAIVHNRAMFGGNSSSEVKLFPENSSGKQPWIKEGGINEELHTEERVRNPDYYLEGTMNAHWDLVLYEWVMREENITPYLNTHMHQVIMKDPSSIDSIFAIQLGTEKSFNIKGDFFVDSTGDGVLGALSKADLRWGRESQNEYGEPLAPDKPDEVVMGNTLFFSARDFGRKVPFQLPEWASKFENKPFKRGVGNIEGGYWWIEVGTPYHPIKDNNKSRHEALRQLLGVWDYIKNGQEDKVLKEKAETYGLEFVGFWPYKRASRRIIGDYVITQKDVQNPKILHDAVAYGTWDIDVHVSGGILARDKEPIPWPTDDKNWQDLCTVVYDIPIRSLYSKKVNNLFMAGRPISASYLAFASSRVLTTGAICGQAVGVIAAIAKKHKVLPRKVASDHFEEVQQLILREDGYIRGVDNLDPNDLARWAKVTSDKETQSLTFPKPYGSYDLKYPFAQMFPVSANEIKQVKIYVQSTLKKDIRVRVGLRKASFVWDFRSDMNVGFSETILKAGFDGWLTFDFNKEVAPGSLYYIYTTDPLPGVRWKSYRDKPGEPSIVPIGTTAAYLPPKTAFDEKSEVFKELFSDVALEDIPGAGKEGHWKPLNMGRCLATMVLPEMYPYDPMNIITGTNRPDKWTNIWISDPKSKFPVHLEFSWEAAVTLNTIQLTFDTDQNKRVTLPLFKYKECVKDYDIEYFGEEGWERILSVRDNYVRRRVHKFDAIETRRVRLKILATNGAKSARVYEVRMYNE